MNISDFQMLVGWVVSVASIWAYVQVKFANIFKELEWIKKTYANDKTDKEKLIRSFIEEIKKVNSKINKVAEDMAVLKTKLEVAECWKPAEKRNLNV